MNFSIYQMINGCLLAGCFFFCSCLSDKPLSEEELANRETLFQSIQQDGALPIHIKADLNAILFRKQSAEKYSATIDYTTRSGKKVNWKAELTPRGNMRNKHCLFPPLKIDLSKSDLQEAGYNPLFDDLKMVIPCKDEEASYDLVLKEYLAYKLYNEITDLSFRVQLVDLTLEDKAGKLASITGKAFLIEKDDELAQRLNGRVLKPTNASRDALQAEIFDQMCLFQYMIGNTDWYIYNMHNVKILKAEGYLFPLPIPYDFDYAGMVDADYATPHERLPLEDVSTRFYLGACRDKSELQRSFDHFKEKEPNILRICEEFATLCPRAQEEVDNYVRQFYTILNNPAEREALIVQHCDKHIKMKK